MVAERGEDAKSSLAVRRIASRRGVCYKLVPRGTLAVRILA